MEISNAYSKALELEGLLLLLKSENTDSFKIDLIFTRLFEKIDEISADLDSIHRQYQIELYHAAQQHLKDNSEIINKPKSDDSETGSPQLDEQAVNVENIANFENNDTNASLNINEEPVQIHLQSDGSVDVAENSIEPQEIEDGVVSIDQVEKENTPDVNIVESEDSVATEDSNDSKLDIAYNNEDVESIQVNHDNIDVPINIVVDEANCIDVNQSAFARSSRGDIRKMFTLNDNYKFRRQLFANSQQQYTDALSRIGNMNSISEAEAYFYNILGWDRDDADVTDFMTIISAYFMGK